jgi:hypothetical protein
LPTSSVSSQVSDAIYYASIILLSLLLARPVYLAYSGSQERGAQTVSSSLAAVIDAMSPGMTLVTSLQAYPGIPLTVTLSGTSVSASVGHASSSSPVRWQLQRALLLPGTDYSFTLRGGTVEVVALRHD